jgi:preprotein translocase subunit Sec63
MQMRKVEMLNEVSHELTNSSNDLILTTDMLIKVLHSSRRSIQNFRDSGKLTFYKVGGKILYRMSDVNKMLDKHKIKSF